MASNFSFLRTEWPALFSESQRAEQSALTDPRSLASGSLIMARVTAAVDSSRHRDNAVMASARNRINAKAADSRVPSLMLFMEMSLSQKAVTAKNSAAKGGR